MIADGLFSDAKSIALDIGGCHGSSLQAVIVYGSPYQDFTWVMEI